MSVDFNETLTAGELAERAMSDAEAGARPGNVCIKRGPVVNIKGTIQEFEPDIAVRAKHQHFVVRANQVRVVSERPGSDEAVDNVEWVSVRYGDELGLPSPVPDLEIGAEIEVQGEYIDDSSPDFQEKPTNPHNYSVLHFTHQPCGYVKYRGKKYD